MPIFHVKSVKNATFSRKIGRKCQFFALNLKKIYTGQKKFTRASLVGSWQIWGMLRAWTFSILNFVNCWFLNVLLHDFFSAAMVPWQGESLRKRLSHWQRLFAWHARALDMDFAARQSTIIPNPRTGPPSTIYWESRSSARSTAAVEVEMACGSRDGRW